MVLGFDTSKLQDGMAGITSTVDQATGEITKSSGNLFSGFKDTVDSGIDAGQDVSANFFNDVTSGFDEVADSGGDIINKATGGFMNFTEETNDTINDVTGGIDDVIGGAGDSIGDAVNSGGEVVDDSLNMSMDFLENFTSGIADETGDVVSGFTGGQDAGESFGGFLSDVVDSGTDVVQGTVETVQDPLNIEGISGTLKWAILGVGVWILIDSME